MTKSARFYKTDCRPSDKVLSDLVTFNPSSKRETVVGLAMRKGNQLAEDCARFARAPNLPDIELLTATYVSHTFSRHTHETFAIGVVHTGEGAYDCEGRRWVVRPGDLILINPGDLHNGGAAEGIGVSYRMCYITAARIERVNRALDLRGPSLPYFPRQAVRHPAIGRLVDKLFDALEGTASPLEQEEKLISTLARLITTFSSIRIDERPVRECPKGIIQARTALEDRYAERIGLAELAELAQLSPYHFLCVFRAGVGIPPHAYQTQVRIAKARTLLERGTTLADVAAKMGFVDQSHFTRAFKRIVGVPPGQYASAVSAACCQAAGD